VNAANWIVLLVALGVVFWAVTTYNALVQGRNRVKNAFAQIDVQLKRRYDLLPNLVEVARRYLAHEAATLEAVTRARGDAVGAADHARFHSTDPAAIGKLAKAEDALAGSLGKLMVVVESYPELKADATMNSLSEELTSTENRIGFARQAYNDEVLEYNDAVGQLPGLIVARACGFAPTAMLESTRNEQEREAPRLAF
jgi:LemA protein